jgi:hypothetical protein
MRKLSSQEMTFGLVEGKKYLLTSDFGNIWVHHKSFIGYELERQNIVLCFEGGSEFGLCNVLWGQTFQDDIYLTTED